MALGRRTLLPPLLVLALVAAACGGGGDDDAVTATARISGPTTTPTLYWLDVTENAVYRATGPEFDDVTRLVAPTDLGPDGIDVDVTTGHVYWTSMGLTWTDSLDVVPTGGALQRSRLDGSEVARIVEPGVTLVPKQLALDVADGRLYWGDREGATLWRARLDGTEPEPLVRGHGLVEVVGVALDPERGHVYFSDRTGKRIYRTSTTMPPGQTAEDRTDVELLVESTTAAMPVDLDVDVEHGHLYWTDRFLGTVQRVDLETPAGSSPADRPDQRTVVDGLTEPVGLSLDVAHNRMYVGVLSGGVYEYALDGGDQRKVAQTGSVTGVAMVHVPDAPG